MRLLDRFLAHAIARRRVILVGHGGMTREYDAAGNRRWNGADGDLPCRTGTGNHRAPNFPFLYLLAGFARMGRT
jgi:hypothetical protein